MMKEQVQVAPEIPPPVILLMKPGVTSVESYASALEVARIMKHQGIRNVFVVRSGGPVGLVRDIDIVTNVAALRLDPATITAEQIMLSPPPMVGPRAGIAEIAELMARTGARRVLVANNEKMLGTITAGDLLGLVSNIPRSAFQHVYRRLQREI